MPGSHAWDPGSPVDYNLLSKLRATALDCGNVTIELPEAQNAFSFRCMLPDKIEDA